MIKFKFYSLNCLKIQLFGNNRNDKIQNYLKIHYFGNSKNDNVFSLNCLKIQLFGNNTNGKMLYINVRPAPHPCF